MTPIRRRSSVSTPSLPSLIGVSSRHDRSPPRAPQERPGVSTTRQTTGCSTSTTAGWLAIGAVLPGTGLVIGGDTNLYRAAADILKTDDVFRVGQLDIRPRSVSPDAGDIQFGDGSGWRVGFGPATGAEAGIRKVTIYDHGAVDVTGALTVTGNVSSGGQSLVKTNDARLTNQRAPLSPETALRTIRGTVNGDGTIAQGSGFTVTKAADPTVGEYTVTFSTAFSGPPSVDVTPIGAIRAVALNGHPLAGSTAISIGANQAFCFTATGPA